MNIALEHLEMIPEILELLKELNTVQSSQVETRWLTVKTLSKYINYSTSSIYDKVENGDFQIGLHYYRHDKKLIFDKVEIDNWVRGRLSTNNQTYENTEKLVNSLLESVS